MKKIVLSILTVASVITISSCSKSDNNSSTPSTKANVMFVNGSAGTTPIDASVNGTAVTSGSNLAYLKGTGYLNVASGNDTLAFLYHSTGTLFNSTTTTLTAGANYTVFAGGLINPSTVIVTSDDLSVPATGFAKVRVVNLSPDTLHLTANIGLTTLVSGLTTGQASAFMSVTAGTGNTVLLGVPGNNSIAVTLSNQTFASGKIYTIMFTGTMNGASTVGLAATVLNNN